MFQLEAQAAEVGDRPARLLVKRAPDEDAAVPQERDVGRSRIDGNVRDLTDDRRHPNVGHLDLGKHATRAGQNGVRLLRAVAAQVHHRAEVEAEGTLGTLVDGRFVGARRVGQPPADDLHPLRSPLGRRPDQDLAGPPA